MSPVSLPVMAAAGLAGALVIDFGIKNIKSAGAQNAASGSSGSSPGTGSGSGSSSGGPNQTVTGTGTVVSGSGMSANQAAFARQLQADTGLSASVIAGWMHAEQPTGSTSAPNGTNNWLNVGSFDDGFEGGGANVWEDPAAAADATAAFILGHPVNGYDSPVGPGSSSIRAIAATAGQSIEAQVNAIQSSDWASSHYGYNLMSDVEQFLSLK
jgi:hypothetical protein